MAPQSLHRIITYSQQRHVRRVQRGSWSTASCLSLFSCLDVLCLERLTLPPIHPIPALIEKTRLQPPGVGVICVLWQPSTASPGPQSRRRGSETAIRERRCAICACVGMLATSRAGRCRHSCGVQPASHAPAYCSMDAPSRPLSGRSGIACMRQAGPPVGAPALHGGAKPAPSGRSIPPDSEWSRVCVNGLDSCECHPENIHTLRAACGAVRAATRQQWRSATLTALVMP